MDFFDLDRESASVDFLQFALYCEMLADGRQMPRRQDFSIHDVPWLHDRLYLIDVLDNGADYYVRMFGTFWKALYGDDLTNRRLSEVEAGAHSLDILRPLLDHVVATRTPLSTTAKLVWPGLVSIVFDRLMVPFTADGTSVSQIVAIAHYDDTTENLVFDHGGKLPVSVLDADEPLPVRRAS